jgi:hypothetical protein
MGNKMGSGMGHGGNATDRKKRELQVLVLLTAKADEGNKKERKLKQRRKKSMMTAGNEKMHSDFDRMAKALGLNEGAVMVDTDPNNVPTVDDIMNAYEEGEVDSAFFSLQDRLLVFPDDFDAMTVSPANCACPSRSTACGERGPAGAPQAIAKIYVIREDFKRAEYWFQKAIAGDPRHIDAMIHYGQPRLPSTRYRRHSPATPASAAPDLPRVRARREASRRRAGRRPTRGHGVLAHARVRADACPRSRHVRLVRGEGRGVSD